MRGDKIFTVTLRNSQGGVTIEADSFKCDDLWMIFYRTPPQGGIQEYWRVRMDVVATMQTDNR